MKKKQSEKKFFKKLFKQKLKSKQINNNIKINKNKKYIMEEISMRKKKKKKSIFLTLIVHLTFGPHFFLLTQYAHSHA